jgi:hypothetical protein
VTPQATLAVIDYEVPGLAEAMRAAGRTHTPMADLSRGVVGVIGRSLVVNVPGSPRAALESLAALEPTLVHALETLAGPFDHGEARAGAVPHRDLPGPAAGGRSLDRSLDRRATENPAPRDHDSRPEPAVLVDANDEWRDLPEPGNP